MVLKNIIMADFKEITDRLTAELEKIKEISDRNNISPVDKSSEVYDDTLTKLKEEFGDLTIQYG